LRLPLLATAVVNPSPRCCPAKHPPELLRHWSYRRLGDGLRRSRFTPDARYRITLALTSQSRNTYRTHEVTVHYRWHPFHGCKLRLVKTAKIAGVDDLYCETPGGIVLGIPRWMTDPGRCAAMEVADQSPPAGLDTSDIRTLRQHRLHVQLPDARHNRPIRAHFQSVGSLRTSVRILARRLESRTRRVREARSGRARRNISSTC
jgi:hypothetical protein